MKATVFFIFYFLMASLIAATIAYPLFQLVGNDTYRFESWVTRSALLFLILGLIPCIKYFDLSLRSLGHNQSFPNFFKKASRGFISGLIILGVVVASLIYLDVRTLADDAQLTLTFILKALAAGLIVALIEETLFRGLFFKLTKKWHGGYTAVLVSSFFYAILHFIKPVEHIEQTLLNFNSGFEVIANAFKGISFMTTDDFFALFVVGILLALVRRQTHTLAYCIGLHASWVFLLKITKELTDGNNVSNLAFLTGQYDGIIGWFSFIWIALLAFAYMIYIIKSNNHQHS
ncbi:MAG: CPBP family intramembrane metalloprotease [Cycloclasticus sp.]|jgi:membrane protease YdiL (CAAX protease family)|nr:CPBP family intramembrane metalloprotease [Cycloclasticus sp.]MEE4291931.1 CPBP family intramembrane glutamic endopeptidase [Cycloclasticus sp.]